MMAKTDFCFNILDKLVHHLESRSTQEDCCQYYELVGQLLEEIEQIQNEKNKTRINSSRLFEIMKEKILLHRINEPKVCSPPDKTFIGYVNLADHILQLNPDLAALLPADFGLRFFHTHLFSLSQNELGRICKTRESRKICYKFLLTILKLSFSQLKSVLLPSTQNEGLLLLNSLPLFITKAAIRHERESFVGLYNMRNICYVNSVLQQLFMNSSLRALVFALQSQNAQEPHESSFLHQLQRLFSHLQDSHRAFADPAALCHSIRDLDGEPIDVNIQEDANEFQNRLFDLIEQESKVPRSY